MVFRDLQNLRRNGVKEVDEIVQKAYQELKGPMKGAINPMKMWQARCILLRYLGELRLLSLDPGQALMEMNPVLYKYGLDRTFRQLNHFGNKLDPNAKRRVQKVFEEIQKVVDTRFAVRKVEYQRLLRADAKKIRVIAQQAHN